MKSGVSGIGSGDGLRGSNEVSRWHTHVGVASNKKDRVALATRPGPSDRFDQVFIEAPDHIIAEFNAVFAC